MNTQFRTLAGRYAAAYVGTSISRGDLEGAKGKLSALESCLAKISDKADFVSHPLIPVAEKIVFMQAIVSEKADAPAEGLLELLIKEKRFAISGLIAEECRALIESASGIKRAEVRTAFPMSREIEARVRSALEKVTGKKIVIEKGVSPDIIGGMEIEIGDLFFDYSIRGKLRRLKQELFT